MGNLNIRKAPAKFTERLDIAENYVRTGRLEFLNWGNRGGKFCEVELSEFSSWAIEMEWDLPEAFPKTPKMKKPQFYDLKAFCNDEKEDYKICNITILRSWLKDKYNI